MRPFLAELYGRRFSKLPWHDLRFAIAFEAIQRESLCKIWLCLVLLTAGAYALGCGGGGAGFVTPSPAPPPSISVTVSPASSAVILGNAQKFTATVTNTSDKTVTWSVNGVPGGNAVWGTISPSGVYSAPANLPVPATVQVSATSQADTTKSGAAQLTIVSDLTLAITPPSASVELGATQSFHAIVTSSGHPDTAVQWSVAGGTCPNACGEVDINGNYTAPQILPQLANLLLTAQSVADPSKRTSVPVNITSNFLFQLSAPSSVLTGASVLATATLTPVPGSHPSGVVTWSLSGPGCNAMTCGALSAGSTSAGASGAITNTVTYTAPATAPVPSAVTVTATPQADPSRKTQAILAIQTGAISGNVNIVALHPASVYAGGADGFLLRVDGNGFVASSPGPGSALLITGTLRTTTCSSVTECTAPVMPADVVTAGNVSVQIQNPDGSKSNLVSLVVLAPGGPDAVISLTNTLPAATGKDIVVVEPTTAGVSVPGNDVDLNVAALGAFSTANNSCTLAGNPIILLPPLSGTSAADVCLFSESGLDTSMSYTVSGTGDVAVVAKQPAGLGIIHLTLQISANALPGARTLFIQNTNLDKTAATGVLEIQ